MGFWIIIAAMTLAVIALLALSVRLGARTAPAAPGTSDLRVYQDQLREVDKDVARGVLNADDAERVKTEISRRILAADAAVRDTQTPALRRVGDNVLMASIALCLVAGSGVLYWQLGNPDYPDQALKDRIALAGEFLENRPSQAAAEESLSRSDLPRVENPSPDYVALVAQLRNVVANRPDDIEGLRLLAISERKLGNFNAAHTAFGRHIELRGGDVSSGEWSDLADMMILAANGYVSPEAQVALQSALALDPTNPPARYYWGQMMSQTGRPDIAFRTWDALLREGPADAPWIPPIMAQINEMAMRAGEMGYTPPQIGVAGPSTADIEAAEDMSASERMEMIEGMVSGLSDTLATEGGPPEKWAQLITALGVLGRTDQAAAVFANAVQVFANNPSAMDLINRAGDRAGVSN